MADLLWKISIISYTLSVLMFLLTIGFWFWFRIPFIIGELSGRNAQKSIEAIKRNNELKAKKQTKKKKHEGIKAAVEPVAENKNSLAACPEKPVMFVGAETEVLEEENVTAPLLEEDSEAPAYAGKGVQLEMIEEIIVVDTGETI